MTLAEILFVVAGVAFVVEAMPLLGLASPVKLQPAGLALVAFGLALSAGLAATLGVEGKIF